MRLELRGTEARTIELRGSLSPDDARRLLAATRLAPEPAGDRVAVSLLLFDMRALALRGVPGPRFDYGEALWRVGVLHDGRPSWLGVTCDLDHPLVRRTGALLVRYPVREARFAFDDRGDPWTARVEAGARSLDVTVRVRADEAPIEPPRPMLVPAGERLYRIPWEEEPAPFRRHASAEVRGALGEVTLGASLRWDEAAMVHRGRVHRCGVAGRLR
jgi:hypothetical protein